MGGNTRSQGAHRRIGYKVPLKAHVLKVGMPCDGLGFNH